MVRIIVAGDLSGRGLGGEEGRPCDLRPIHLDIDAFGAVLRRVAPIARVQVGDEGPEVEIVFNSLDDFHPDSLYQRLSMFAALRCLRERLLDPATFVAAASDLKRAAAAPLAAPAAASPSATAAEDERTMLARLLGAPAERSAPLHEQAAADALSHLIARIVAPHVVRIDSAELRLLIAAVDDAIAQLMRSILHAPAVQALEATWRGLWWLLSNLPDDADLAFSLVDAGKEDVAADLLGNGDDIRASAFYRRVVEEGRRTWGGKPWSLIVGLFDFAADEQDVALLKALGRVSAAAGAPFVAAASPALLGCGNLFEMPDPRQWQPLPAEDEARWQALRTSPMASWIGLVLPRVLMRVPYGRKSDPIDAFAFEECPGRHDHGAYLWGHPALACALVLARGRAEPAGEMLEIGDLPAHTYEADNGEKVLKACAEVFLSDRAADAILARGPMPILSHRHRNAVRLARVQSIADPPTPLVGTCGGVR